jgi:hypothetical protein
MTKGDLMKLALTKEEQSYCDSAIPMSLWEGIDTSLHVFDCRNHKLINLAEKLVGSGKLDEIVDDRNHLKYTNKHLKKAIVKANLTKDDPYLEILMEDDEEEKKEIPNGHTFSDYGG